MQHAKGISHCLVGLDGITTTASINQVAIFEASTGIYRLGFKMIEFEFTPELPPGLAFQTIDTSKIKVIANPRAVAFV
jgi:hypothetical protein